MGNVTIEVGQDIIIRDLKWRVIELLPDTGKYMAERYHGPHRITTVEYVPEDNNG